MWTPTRVLAAAVIWLGLAVASATQRAVAHDLPYGPVLVQAILDWGSCAVFTPLVLAFVQRSPIGRATWLAYLPRYAAAIVALVIARYTLLFALLHAVGTPPAWTLRQALTRGFAAEAIAFGALFAIVHAIVIADRLRDEQVHGLALRAELADARLDALVHKLEPHFLFNTLQAISTLLHRDPRAADAMLTRLSELLRELLRGDARRPVPLADELALAQRYLDIMAIRFADRLTTRIDAPEALAAALVPQLVLQPLLENALRHGVTERPSGASITVTASRDGDGLRIRVLDEAAGDTGGGEASELRDVRDSTAGTGNGIGLANTRERLRTLYGNAARLETGTVPGGGYSATLVLPIRFAS